MATSLQLENAYNCLKRINAGFPTIRVEMTGLISMLTDLNMNIVYGPKDSIYYLIYKNISAILHGGTTVSISGRTIARKEDGLNYLFSLVKEYCEDVNEYIIKTDKEQNTSTEYKDVIYNEISSSRSFVLREANGEIWNISSLSKVKEHISLISSKVPVLIDAIVKVRDEIKSIRSNGIEIEQINYEGISIIAEDGMIEGVERLFATINELIRIINEKVAGVEELNEKLTEEQQAMLDMMNRVDQKALPSGYYFEPKADGTGLTGRLIVPGTLGAEGNLLNTVVFNQDKVEFYPASGHSSPMSMEGINRTSGYGPRNRMLLDNGTWSSDRHLGQDIVSSDSSVMTTAGGVVAETGYQSSYGNYIIINHDDGTQTLYAHLNSINTAKDARVEQGEHIGVMGATGGVRGAHLHYEVRLYNQQTGQYDRINPMPYLEEGRVQIFNPNTRQVEDAEPGTYMVNDRPYP